MMMPDGTAFQLWEDETAYLRVYHVAKQHPRASDDNPGTEQEPFATISGAAALLQPGEKVIVHEGVYRECVCPARGGTGPAGMIAYEAAPGESVTIKGSEVWLPAFAPSQGWRLRGRKEAAEADGPRLWMADLPVGAFAGYNPFLAPNVPAEIWTFTKDWQQEEIERFLLKRGALFLEGRPLKQVFRITSLVKTEGAFWVEDPGTRVHLRLWEDVDPNGLTFEVTVREQVFAPRERHLGYIRVSGFQMEHAADGVPVPQRAALSTNRGHHWIIEDNWVRRANAVGLDVGAQDWKADEKDRSGHHIIRRNRISDCGICGIAGGTGADHTLVEGNVIERIGGLNVERIWECAGLKFHVCTGSLFRGNVFRHIRSACGMWLDVLNRNCRVTGNLFADIESRIGGIWLECSQEQGNLFDSNVFWDIRQVEGAHWPDPPETKRTGGMGLNLDTGENTVVAHNLFGRLEGFAVSANLHQANSVIEKRAGLCRRHRVLNNVFAECPKRILLARLEDNISDGNLFDERDDRASLVLQYPAPEAVVDLDAWQRYFGLDTHSSQAQIQVEIDIDQLSFGIRVDGQLPSCQPVEAMHGEEGTLPGPCGEPGWGADGRGREGRFLRGE